LRLAATKLHLGRIILSPDLVVTVPPHNTLQPHGHYTCSSKSIVMSDNGDYFDWDAFISNPGGVDEGEAEQRHSPAAFDYSTVNMPSNTTRTALARQQQFNYELYDTGEDVRTADTYQPVPYSGTQPMVTSPNHTEEWSDLEWSQRFYRSGGGQGGDYSASTQETFPWHPRVPLHHRDNSIVADMLSGHPTVNMQQVNNLMEDADQSTLNPHFNTNPRAWNTYLSVNQLCSPGQGSAINHVGPNALASRVVPARSLVPPAGQQRHPIAHGRSAADTASVRTGPVNHLPDLSMYHGGQARLGPGAQHLGDNTDQTAFVFCPDPTCRKQFRDQVGLQYELPAMPPSTPG
jgi:hypothetical protein